MNNIRVEFSNLNAEELKGIKQLYDSLVKLKHAKQDEAEKRREDLRHELHKYGALHLEPDTELFANQMEEVVQSPELEEFMRKSGGLKAELVKTSEGAPSAQQPPQRSKSQQRQPRISTHRDSSSAQAQDSI